MRQYVRRIGNYHRDIKLYLLYTLFANVAIGVFALVFNLYLLELGQREDFIGIYNALQTAAMAATALAMGKLIERLGIWMVVVLGLVSYLAASTLLVFLTQPALLVLVGMLWGGGTAFVFTPVMPFIVELTRTRQRQDVAALTMSLVSLSTTVGSLVGGWAPLVFSAALGFGLPSADAFRGTMLVGILLAGLGLIPLFKMSEQRKRARPADSGLHESQPGLLEVTPSMVRRRMLVYIAVAALMSLGAGAVFPFYNVFLASIGASSGEIGLVFAGAWILAAFTGLGAPYLAGKLGSHRAAPFIRLVPVPLYLLLIAVPVIPVAVVAHLIRTSSITVSWSIEGSFISDILPRRIRYAAFGYRSAAWNVGFSISAFLAGGLIVRYGYSPTFAIYAAFMAGSMALFYFYFRRFPAVPLAADEPDLGLPVRPEPEPVRTVAEADAPERLTLTPGRGQPIIVVSEESEIAEEDQQPVREEPPD